MNSADKVGWGGRTSTSHDSSSPPMGCGYFPDLNFHHASYFRLISYKKASKRIYGPKDHQIEKYIDKPNCFGLYITFYMNFKK